MSGKNPSHESGDGVEQNPSPVVSLALDATLSRKGRGEESAGSRELSQTWSARLAQAEPARDDAAQHLGGAALNGELWRGLHRER